MRRLVALLAVGLVLAACEQSAREGTADASKKTASSFVVGSRLLKTRKAVPGRYIVVLDEAAMTREPQAQKLSARARVEQLAHELSALHAASVGQVYSRSLQGFSAEMTEEAALRLSNDPRVRYVEEDGEASLATTQQGVPWALDRIDQRELQQNDGLYHYSLTGSGVHAYVIDSGIRFTHSEFGGRAVPGFSVIEDGKGSSDCYGHGTYVASILGGTRYGAAKGVTLHSVRVVPCGGAFTWSQVIAGIDWVTANHVKPAVATLSLTGEPMQAVDDALAASIDAGVFYAVAAGNAKQDACAFSPARLPAAMTVGGSDYNDNWGSSFSNHGSCVDLFAPGASVHGAWGNGDDTLVTVRDGTSGAGAFVAGVASLFLESHPQATPAQVATELTGNATPGKLQSLPAGSPNLLLYSPTCNGNGPNPPQVAITSPSSGATLSGTVTFTATATDDEHVSRVEFFLDGHSLGWDGTAPYEVTWNSALGANGPGVLTARVSDTNCTEVESAPVSVTLQNVGIAAFHAAWGAPSCATVGNTCDSAWLLEGRGPLGPELHQPNTVGGSCADGTEPPSYGGLGNTSMIQRLIVSRSDGTAFAAGKEVKVQVQTRTNTDIDEVLDLYVAPDPSNPTWTRVDTLFTPQYVAGVPTYSTTYVLPSGGRHVLRAVYRSSSGTAAPCSSQTVADHDDLVIAVGQEPDSTPPVVSLTSPTQGAKLQYAVEVTMSASDNFGVDHVELYAGNTRIGTIPHADANSYRFLWDTRTMPNGTYALTARAYDLAGNVTTSAPVNVTLNNDFVPPQVTLSSPANGATVSQTIPLTGTVSDDRSVGRISFFLDGTYLGDAAYWTYPSGAFNSSWDTRTTSNGPHVFGVKAYDSAGNASPLITANVVVDNDYISPQVAITSPANGAVVSGALSVEVAATDDRGVLDVSFYVDDKLVGTDTAAPYTFPWNSADALNGSHTFKATVRDTASNFATSAVVTVQANNPGSAGFDPVLMVPRCDTVEALCDTRTLVKGRGTMSSGPELNASNTLDGCADGNSGSYKTDESIERLQVRREDGTALTAGKRVRIDADVYVRLVASDTLDLYYSTTVSASPAWTYLTSVKPTATGPQRLSAEYVLPDSGLQAIRAVFRGTSTFSLCEWSSTTDRDDLIFAVGPREADLVPPDSVALTAPASGATVNGTVTLTASVGNDNLGVAAVDFFDGDTLIDTDTQPPYSVSWNSRNGPNGSHTLKARARDLAGNSVTSQTVTVTADNDFVAPVVSITSPAPGAQLGALAVELTANASDDRGVTRVEFYDGTTLRYTDSSAPYGLSWAPPVWQPGSHTLTARAYDAGGNMTISAPVEVRVFAAESTPPSIAITSPGTGAKVGGTVTISVDATDASGVSQVEFFLDGVRLGNTTAAPYGYSWNARSVANGAHTLRARATDLHGNVADSALVSVRVDNTAPTVALTSPASGAVLVGVVSLQANAADNEGVAQVDFLVDGAVVASDTTAPYGVDWDSGFWVNGNHTLVARARDEANNVTSSTQLTVSTNQPGAATFDFSYRAPLCSGLSNLCDTTGYVKGRYHEGPYNDPGTIRLSCADGTDALEAQRIDRLKLSSVTGTRFTQGQRVRIEVYVNAVDTTTDALDLFFTRDADASSPTWTYLTTLVPGATGPQVLSAEYVLPGGTVQAVRAQFRAGAGNGTACSTGPRDDHDDVVFSVDSGPEVSLSTLPSLPANGQVRGSIWLYATAEDAQGVVRVEIYDGSTLIFSDTSGSYSYLPTWDTTTVADGFHVLTLRAYDSGGLTTTSDPLLVTVDNTPPAAAISSPAPGTFVRGVALIDATATDNQAISRVEFYDGSTLLGTATGTPYTWSWNTVGGADGARTLTVRAYDLAGNARTSAGVAVTVDNTAPTAAAISAPAQNALVGGLVQVSATASDSRGVARVELFVDGTPSGSDTSAPYTVSWNSATVADGAHALTVKAHDNAGNTLTSAAVAVNVDNTPPDAELTSPAQGALFRGSVTLEATASDGQGVQRVEFYSDATLVGTSYAPPYTTSGFLADGAHTLTVRAYDLVGNMRTSAGVGVTVDNTSPTTAVSAPAQNARIRGTVQVSATASDNVAVASVEFYMGSTLLGTATTAPYSVSWDTTTVANGAVTLTTKAYDTVGNVTVSAGRSVTVDNAAPTVAITSPANGASFSALSLSTTIQASASDNVGVTQVVFYDGGSVLGTDTTAPYSVSWNLLGASKGTHTLTARAYDAAGNVTTSAAVSVKVN